MRIINLLQVSWWRYRGQLVKPLQVLTIFLIIPTLIFLYSSERASVLMGRTVLANKVIRITLLRGDSAFMERIECFMM